MYTVYKIGDYVEAVTDHPEGNRTIVIGDTGTICDFDDGMIGVEWDRKITFGHDCYQHCERGYGWYIQPNDIRLCEIPDIEEDSFLKIMR